MFLGTIPIAVKDSKKKTIAVNKSDPTVVGKSIPLFPVRSSRPRQTNPLLLAVSFPPFPSQLAHQNQETPPVPSKKKKRKKKKKHHRFLEFLIPPPRAVRSEQWSSSRTRGRCGSRATSARTSAPTTRRPSPTATAATPAARSGRWSPPATSTYASRAIAASTSAPPTAPRPSTPPPPAAASRRACHPRPTTAPSSGRRAGTGSAAAASRWPGPSAASSAPAASGRRRGSPWTSRSSPRRRAPGRSRSSRRSRRRGRPAAFTPATLGWRRRGRSPPSPAPSSGSIPPRNQETSLIRSRHQSRSPCTCRRGARSSTTRPGRTAAWTTLTRGPGGTSRSTRRASPRCAAGFKRRPTTRTSSSAAGAAAAALRGCTPSSWTCRPATMKWSLSWSCCHLQRQMNFSGHMDVVWHHHKKE